MSKFLSPQGKAYLDQHLHDMQDPKMTYADKGVPPLTAPYLERQMVLFAVNMDDTKIAGVHAYVYVPKAGIHGKNTDRVLIDLQALRWVLQDAGPVVPNWNRCQSRRWTGIKVVSLDYRQGPDL